MNYVKVLMLDGTTTEIDLDTCTTFILGGPDVGKVIPPKTNGEDGGGGPVRRKPRPRKPVEPAPGSR